MKVGIPGEDWNQGGWKWAKKCVPGEGTARTNEQRKNCYNSWMERRKQEREQQTLESFRARQKSGLQQGAVVGEGVRRYHGKWPTIDLEPGLGSLGNSWQTIRKKQLSLLSSLQKFRKENRYQTHVNTLSVHI